MMFDPTYPDIDMSQFKKCNCKVLYLGAKEVMPPNAHPPERDKEVDLRMFVDSDHAGESVTRRSRSGHFIFINMTCIAWYSRKQNTVETFVFESEFVSMKISMEAVRGLRCKLRMMGVPLSGLAYIW